jgi:two-component system, OmpR family, phosphate regulon response regulator PhoB
MSTRILVVEDDGAINMMLRYNLEAEGFSVEVVESGEAAEVSLAEERPDLLVLDWMLPGLSGIELCRRLRAGKTTRGLPILMLTARGEEGDRIRGLTTGADDYVTKPFSPAELTARIKALLRRSDPERLADKIVAGDIELDRDAHRAVRNGRELRLGPTEFKLLEHFMRTPGRVLSRNQLLDSVWGRDVYIDERTVDVHIGRLRKSLVRGKERDPIRTVRGAGYVFGEREGA